MNQISEEINSTTVVDEQTIDNATKGTESKSSNEGTSESSSSNSSNVTLHIIDGIKFWTRAVDNTPYVGQTFNSSEEGEAFYKEYARKCGFETRLSTTRKIKGVAGNGRRIIVCNKQGQKKEAAYDTLVDKKKKKRKKPSIRVGCQACLKIGVDVDKKWTVSHFEEKHNHELVNEEDRYFLKSERRLTYSQKRMIHDLSNINIGPNTAYKLMKQSRGGFENTGATETDAKNFKRDFNSFIGLSDADMVIEKFNKKKEFLQDFSFDFTVGSDGSLTGLFWADEEAKRNYFAFGDVVGFDATYRTNKYSMIFVPFTGIDNHKRCVTFGAGFISSETIESYKWVLNAFKKTFVEEPNVFVTDQDAALLQVVPAVFKKARHRLCMWHISQKFTDKLGTKKIDTDVLQELNDLVWNERIKKEDFESTWKMIMDKFELNDISWFSDMYDMKDLWIPAYFKECAFSGLMRTTSRSEAENHFYGLISNTDLHLIEFINHFETAIDGQRFVQRKNDHDSRYTHPDFKSKLNIEREAAELFTRNIFFDIKKEIIASMMSCMSIRVEEIEGLTKIIVKDTNKNPKYYGEFQVSFFKSELIVLCSCLRFELTGHLCRHCFYALRMHGVETYPKKYVSRRWTKDVVPRTTYGYNLTKIPISEKKEEIHSIVRDLYFSMDFCVDRMVNDLESLRKFRDEMKEKMTTVQNETKYAKPMKNKEVIESLMGVVQKENITILPPTQVSTKGSGRPKKRMKGKKEIAIEKAKKDGRRCRKCNKFIPFGSTEKHDKRNCHKFQAQETSKDNDV